MKRKTFIQLKYKYAVNNTSYAVKKRKRKRKKM